MIHIWLSLKKMPRKKCQKVFLLAEIVKLFLSGGFKLRNLFSKTECKESVNILLFTCELKLPSGEVSKVIALK